jgi:hypothetical protein
MSKKDPNKILNRISLFLFGVIVGFILAASLIECGYENEDDKPIKKVILFQKCDN